MAEVAGLSITLDANVAPSESALQSFGNTVTKVAAGVGGSLANVGTSFDNATKKISETVVSSVSSLNILSNSFESVEKEVFAAADAFNAKWNPVLEAAQKEAAQTGIAVRNLSQEIKDFANKGIANIDAIKQRFGALTPQFAKVSDGSKMFVNGLGKLTTGSKEAGFALQSIGRVISDLPFGPGGIANNLEILPTAFRAVSTAAKESGQSIGSVLLKSLTGPGGLILAFSAVSAGLSIATFGLSAWTRLFNPGKKAVDDYREALDGIEKAGAKEALQLRTLTTFITDETNTRELRLSAVKKLRSEYGPYLKNLTDEQILSGQIGNALDQINQALLKKVALQAGEEKILPLIKQQLDLQLRQMDLQKQISIGAQINKTDIDRAAAAGIQLPGKLKAGAAGAKIEFDKNSKAIQELNVQIDNLFSGISGFINDATKLDLSKGLGKTKDDAEKIADVLKKLQADRDELSRNPLIAGLDKPEKDIELIEGAIKRLLELKVPQDSTIIQKLIGLEDFGKLISAELQKSAGKFTDDPLPVPVSFTPLVRPISPAQAALLAKSEEEYRKLLFDNLKKGGITSVDTKDGVRIPITPFVATEVLEQGQSRLTEIFKSLSDSILELSKGLQVQIVSTIGDALGTALTGGNIGAALTGLFGGISSAITQLGEQMIALSPIIAGIKAAFSSLSPAGLLLGGIALVALGSSLKNIVGKQTAFAAGGVVSGPVNALVGEYPGASSNPEVIAPLNKLQSMLDFNGGGTQVFIPDLRVEGPDLVIAFNRAQKAMGR